LGGLFEEFFGEGSVVARDGQHVPRLDVSETADAVEVTTDLPGMKPDEVGLEIRGQYLTIRGEHSEEKESAEEEGRKYHRVERSTGSFCRSVRLPATVREDGVEAFLTDGVLKVTMPKSQADKPVKVKVQG